MRSLRLAICDTYYPAALEALYEREPGLEDRPYAEQLRAIMGLRMGTSDAYSHNLRKLGHAADELVLSWPPLQRRWAEEHGVAAVRRRLSLPRGQGRLVDAPLLHRVARAQIEALDAEAVYLQDLWFFSRSEVEALRRDGVLVVSQLGAQPPPDARHELSDLIVSSFPHWVERLQGRGLPCEYFPIGFDARVLDELRADGLPCDPERDERDVLVSFVGGIHAPAVHRGGTALLEGLAREVGLELWGYVDDDLAPDSPIRARHHGPAWGIDMYRVLARSAIAINRHGDIAEDYANNMRLFEATGVGALLMTESARNLPGLFTPGEEVVTYDGPDDLVEKVRYYAEHDAERRAIAAAGQRRTLAEHTYERRMERLDELLRSAAAEPPAAARRA